MVAGVARHKCSKTPKSRTPKERSRIEQSHRTSSSNAIEQSHQTEPSSLAIGQRHRATPSSRAIEHSHQTEPIEQSPRTSSSYAIEQSQRTELTSLTIEHAETPQHRLDQGGQTPTRTPAISKGRRSERRRSRTPNYAKLSNILGKLLRYRTLRTACQL